jgi:hypothetical protein
MDRHVRQTHGAGKSRITVEDWVAELAKESQPDVIPAGWYHAGDVAAKINIPRGKAEAILRRKAEGGKLQRRIMKGVVSGHVREMVFYGPPDSKP